MAGGSGTRSTAEPATQLVRELYYNWFSIMTEPLKDLHTLAQDIGQQAFVSQADLLKEATQLELLLLLGSELEVASAFPDNAPVKKNMVYLRGQLEDKFGLSADDADAYARSSLKKMRDKKLKDLYPDLGLDAP